jgi:hypothetical protein
MSEKPTTLSISAKSIVGASWAAPHTAIDIDITTHLTQPDGWGSNGILCGISQHLTLDEAKELVAKLNLAIAEVELEVLQDN